MVEAVGDMAAKCSSSGRPPSARPSLDKLPSRRSLDRRVSFAVGSQQFGVCVCVCVCVCVRERGWQCVDPDTSPWTSSSHGTVQAWLKPGAA